MSESQNIIHDKQINRIVAYDPNTKRLDVFDQRFYTRNGKYYPSVSTILQYLVKGKFFEQFLKDVGHNAEIIAQKAANEGTQVHNAIEDWLAGKPVSWKDEWGNYKYPIHVWNMILKFQEFWTTHKPKLITSEYHVFSDEHEFAGTMDLVVEIGGELWLIDIKTSKALSESYDLQLAAYATAWNETHDRKIVGTGILWLKALTRGAAKGKIQGEGWQLKVVGEIEKNFEIFKHLQAIYKWMNPDDKPETDSYPIELTPLEPEKPAEE